MVSSSHLSNAHVIFATNRAGISRPGGATVKAHQASVLLIEGDRLASSWLLVKSVGEDGIIVQELNNESDLVTIAPVHSESESFVRIDHQRSCFHLHFETAEAFYCFLLSCRHVGTDDRSWRSAGLSAAVLQNEWRNFKIPCEWPRGVKLFRKFLADDHVPQHTRVSVALDNTGNASPAGDSGVEGVANGRSDVDMVTDAVEFPLNSPNGSPGGLISPETETFPDRCAGLAHAYELVNAFHTSTNTWSIVDSTDGQYPPLNAFASPARIFSATNPAGRTSEENILGSQIRMSGARLLRPCSSKLSGACSKDLTLASPARIFSVTNPAGHTLEKNILGSQIRMAGARLLRPYSPKSSGACSKDLTLASPAHIFSVTNPAGHTLEKNILGSQIRMSGARLLRPYSPKLSSAWSKDLTPSVTTTSKITARYRLNDTVHQAP
ncbi:hypothetical protein BJ138DRAFT_1116073 [Hygrophoropsis aurantiaca]|uniref:Uncharacterized protein n=1 Tax=Hygrophoropsis aurantiaca TaxID=72124 RepID=A0ACB8A542_9AGAM|nr:hypothetical protein BJ138DRAFT_1116073 [Hygrophoropsis aurantiaca]